MKLRGLKEKAANALRISRMQPEMKYDIETFLSLMQSAKWRKVRKILRSPIGREICQQSDKSNLTPLGAAFGCNAPYDIAKKILNYCPAAILKSDDYGSTALHLGCLNGANSEVIDLLLQHDLGKDAALMLDSCHHTPLHHTVLNTCASIEDDRRSRSSRGSSSAERSYSIPSAWFHINDDLYIDSMITNSFKIILHFCIALPEVVVLSTIDGDTPLDMIQNKRLTVSNVENLELLERIYEMLVTAAIAHYKEQKNRWETDGFSQEDVKEVIPESLDESHMSLTDATTQTQESAMSPL